MSIGFNYKKIELLGTNIICSCPSCRRKIIISKNNAKKTKYGYILSKPFNCSCGYSANFILQNSGKINNSATFKRTCKECSSVWNFNKDDATMSDLKKFMTIANPTLATIITESKDYDFNRCDKCGSRKVTLELIDNTPAKVSSSGKLIANIESHTERNKKRIEDLDKKNEERDKRLEELKNENKELLEKRKKEAKEWLEKFTNKK